jgi:hypothetical protein
MPTFKFVAEVTREVTDTVLINVNAESELHAGAIVEEVLQKYPKEHNEVGVPFCYIDNRDYGEVISMDFNLRE